MKIALFTGFGTSLRDYKRLIALLESHGHQVTSGDEKPESLQTAEMIIAHSYGLAKAAATLSNTTAPNLKKLLFISSCLELPPQNIKFWLQAGIGYFHSKLVARDLNALFSKPRHIQKVNLNKPIREIFTGIDVLAILTTKDSIVSYQTQLEITNSLAAPTIAEVAADHNLLDVDFQLILEVIQFRQAVSIEECKSHHK